MALLFTLLFGCGLLASLPDDPEPSCDHRAWYPDADGDGVGEPDSIYVGCAPPTGYVDNVAPVATDTDTDPADTDTATDTDTDTATDTL